MVAPAAGEAGCCLSRWAVVSVEVESVSGASGPLPSWLAGCCLLL
jgi:hypothetical protein